MLPYTPLHYLLMADTGRPIVMTSGNLSEEPIVSDNDDALNRLQDIADYFIFHNRDIHSRYDDSVVMVEQDFPRIVRRARGYAPYPVRLPFQSQPVLACGGQLNNTFCLTQDSHAFISQHIGDMENKETLEHFENTVQLYKQLFRIQPEVIACDLHPDYRVTGWAEVESKKKRLPLIPVQHHHAHIVSCMVDNNIQEPVIGVAFDGTGYGIDGRMWGGEFMVADYHGYERKVHFEYLPLPGGEAAINRPYRTAIGYLYALLGDKALYSDLPCLAGVDKFEVELIKQQINRGLNTPQTSSCGRLFDAVSALLGIRQEIEYEGQAAIELEMIASKSLSDEAYPFQIVEQGQTRVVKVGKMFSAIISDLRKGRDVESISTLFHNTLALVIAQISRQLSIETGIHLVALSGGVFQNRILLDLVAKRLKNSGLFPLIHSQVPCNDGGISLGQAVIANFKRKIER
jgi:hydrogenase maturation protein HypF